MVKNKKMTLEDLAVMVQNGFQHIDEKFTAKLNEHDGVFRSIDKRFDNLEGRFSGLENKTHEVNTRLMQIERDVGDIKDYMEPQKLEFDDLRGRVKYVETKLSIESGK